nr:hypothetical protein [Tanacetum cinerariifolium]
MDAQITVNVVLHGGEMLSIQKVLQNTISVRANEREEASNLITIRNKAARRSHWGELEKFLPVEFTYRKESIRNSVCWLFNGALEDEREESIQEGLDLLVLLAYTRHDLLMDDDLYECLMGITGKENVEGETVSKATDFILVLAEKGERSNDDLGV